MLQKFHKLSALCLAVLLLLSLLSACGQKPRTAEETALMFVKAVVENDLEAFNTCVHPAWLEHDWASSFHVDGEEPDCQITEISTGDITDIPQDEFGTDRYDDDDPRSKITAAKTVTVYMKCFNFQRNKEQSSVFECTVMQIDGQWYALGWS